MKLTKILKNKNNWIFLFILLGGLLVRILLVNHKADGLWYDELWSYYEANSANVFLIIKKLVSEDVHMPLFFVLLHFWIKIFGSMDFSLLMLPAILNFLTIPVAFLTGKLLKSEKFGLALAAITAFNPFIIFYSAELRQYSLIILLSFLSCYFMIKTLQEPCRKNFIYIAIINTLMIITDIQGFLVYTIQSGFIVLYLWNKNRTILKSFIFTQIPPLIAITIFLPMAIFQQYAATFGDVNIYKCMYLGYENILVILQNIFTAYYTDFQDVIYGYYAHFIVIPNFWLLVILPVGLAIYGLIKMLSKKSLESYLAYTGVTIFLVMVISFIVKSIGFLPKYFFIVIPFLITPAYLGLASIRDKVIKKIIFSYIIVLSILTLFVPSQSIIFNHPQKEIGIYPAVKVIKDAGLSKNDFIIYLKGGRDLLSKYLPAKQIDKFRIDNYTNNRFYYANYINKDKRYTLNYLFDLPIKERVTKRILRQKLIENTEGNKVIVNYKKYIDDQIAHKKKGSKIIFIAYKNGVAFTNEYLNISLKRVPELNNGNALANIQYKMSIDTVSILEQNPSLRELSTKETSNFKIYFYKKIS